MADTIPQNKQKQVPSVCLTVTLGHGYDLEIISVCESCHQASILTCNNCGYISDEKIHLDCRNSVIR